MKAIISFIFKYKNSNLDKYVINVHQKMVYYSLNIFLSEYA